jgi:hypothetical protein
MRVCRTFDDLYAKVERHHSTVSSDAANDAIDRLTTIFIERVFVADTPGHRQPLLADPTLRRLVSRHVRHYATQQHGNVFAVKELKRQLLGCAGVGADLTCQRAAQLFFPTRRGPRALIGFTPDEILHAISQNSFDGVSQRRVRDHLVRMLAQDSAWGGAGFSGWIWQCAWQMQKPDRWLAQDVYTTSTSAETAVIHRATSRARTLCGERVDSMFRYPSAVPAGVKEPDQCEECLSRSVRALPQTHSWDEPAFTDEISAVELALEQLVQQTLRNLPSEKTDIVEGLKQQMMPAASAVLARMWHVPAHTF